VPNPEVISSSLVVAVMGMGGRERIISLVRDDDDDDDDDGMTRTIGVVSAIFELRLEIDEDDNGQTDFGHVGVNANADCIIRDMIDI